MALCRGTFFGFSEDKGRIIVEVVEFGISLQALGRKIATADKAIGMVLILEYVALRMKKLCFVFFVFTKDANLDFRIFAVIAILQQEFYGILKFVFQLQAFNVRSNKIIWEGSVLIFRFLELVRINIRVLPDEQIEPRVWLL